MSTDPAVILAEARVAEARRRVNDTLGTLQTRLDPRIVAREAVDGIAESGEKALRTGVETAKAHPGLTVGALTLAGALLARKQIGALFGRRDKTNGATADAPARSISKSSIPGDTPYAGKKDRT